MQKQFIPIAGILAGIAVILGAMGAHALKSIMAPELLESFETAVRYQMYHALALIGIALLQNTFKSKFFNYAGWFMIAGIILFSGSIYLLSLRDILNMPGLIMLGPITPFGGISFILGWLFLVIGGFEKTKMKN